jgi:hypothetical protein
VELVGGPTPAKALTRYRELQSKYAAILAGHDHSHVVIRGVIGEMGAARVRVDSETRADATKLCADLRDQCETSRVIASPASFPSLRLF